MKIALIAPEILPVPPISGGAVEIYIDAIAKRLARMHQVTIFSIADPSLAKSETQNGVHYVRLKSNRKETDQLQYLNRIVAHLHHTGETFDILELFNRPEFVLPLREAGIKSPLLLSMHSNFPVHRFSNEQINTIIKEVAFIPTVSSFVGTTIACEHPEACNKICPIHSGVDLDVFLPHWSDYGRQMRSEVRTSLSINDNDPVILFAGRLHPSKGLHVLLRAMPQILPSNPRLRFLIAGGRWYGSNEADRYVRIVKSLAARWHENIRFLKWVSYPAIARFFLAADFFISASQFEEPLGRVHCEAMACGLPIIASNKGGIGEIVNSETTGLLVDDYENPTAFANAVNRLLADPDGMKAMGVRAYQIAMERLSFDAVAEQISNLFQEATTNKAEEWKLNITGGLR